MSCKLQLALRHNMLVSSSQLELSNKSVCLSNQLFDILINIPVQHNEKPCCSLWASTFPIVWLNWLWDLPLWKPSHFSAVNRDIFSLAPSSLVLVILFPSVNCYFLSLLFLNLEKGNKEVTNGAQNARERVVFVSLLQACNNHFCVWSLFAGEREGRREHRSLWVHLLCLNQTTFFKICYIVLHDETFPFCSYCGTNLFFQLLATF